MVQVWLLTTATSWLPHLRFEVEELLLGLELLLGVGLGEWLELGFK